MPSMIRVTNGDGVGAVYLFGQHGAQQLMRPGGSTKRNHRVGLLEQAGIQPILSTTRKCCAFDRILLQSLNKAGELGTGQILAG